MGVCEEKLLIAEDAENFRGERGEKQEHEVVRETIWQGRNILSAWSVETPGSRARCVREVGVPAKVKENSRATIDPSASLRAS